MDGGKKQRTEGGCFPNGDDSWMLEPYISSVPRLCSCMKILEVSASHFLFRSLKTLADTFAFPQSHDRSSFHCAIPWCDWYI